VGFDEMQLILRQYLINENNNSVRVGRETGISRDCHQGEVGLVAG